MMANLTIGIDLGLVQDYTAMAVVERAVHYVEPAFQEPRSTDYFLVRGIKRWPLGTAYKDVIREVGELLHQRAEQGWLDAQIVIDGTGVGRPVVALFDQAHRERRLGNWWPMSYTITGGREVARRLVPKSDLVGTVQALLQGGRLIVADSLEMAPVLRKELLAFEAKILPTGHNSYGSARERDHDDIVLAVALACWYRHFHSDPAWLDPATLPTARRV